MGELDPGSRATKVIYLVGSYLALGTMNVVSITIDSLNINTLVLSVQSSNLDPALARKECASEFPETDHGCYES